MGEVKLSQSENYVHFGVHVGEKNLLEIEIGSLIAQYNTNVDMVYPLL